jgi:GTPase
MNVDLCVLHDDRTAELAQWICDLLRPVPRVTAATAASAEDAFLTTVVGRIGEKPPATTHHIIITVFWDGTSDASKAAFLPMKGWAAACGGNVVLQALNAKSGKHTLHANADAVVNSIVKRIPVEKSDAAAPADGAAAVVADVDFDDMSAEHIVARIAQGHGETFWLLTAAPDAIRDKAEALKTATAAASCAIFPLLAEPKALDDGRAAWEFVVRRDVETEHSELRIAMCGNVDSGKSTLTSVLTKGFMDDGRGSARAKVFNHKHEQDTGRTSSISENYLGYDAGGCIVNYPVGGPTSSNAKANAKAGVGMREMSSRSSKIVTLYDLAGHEKYLKTTVLGMTRNLPDYACIVISGNNGIQRMTKEHLGLCLALRLPFFIVITRIDSTPENVLSETRASILKLLKVPTVKKLAYPIKRPEDVIVAAKNLKADHITPIFEVSNVTGDGIADVLHFINILPLRKDWAAQLLAPKEMIIDSTFFVTGVGTVVGGIVTQGSFRANDTVMLGPDGLGNFRPVTIKSVHCKGVEVDHVNSGSDAAFCLKKEKRNAVRKGNVLVDPRLKPKAHWRFEAEIRILYHSTTISSNYEPVIHSQTVRQAARITSIDREVLRTGDHAKVCFEFLYRPEYITAGQRLIFREGRTKGIGTVTNTIDVSAAEAGHGDKKGPPPYHSKHATGPAAAAAAATATS